MSTSSEIPLRASSGNDPLLPRLFQELDQKLLAEFRCELISVIPLGAPSGNDQKASLGIFSRNSYGTLSVTTCEIASKTASGIPLGIHSGIPSRAAFRNILRELFPGFLLELFPGINPPGTFHGVLS